MKDLIRFSGFWSLGKKNRASENDMEKTTKESEHEMDAGLT